MFFSRTFICVAVLQGSFSVNLIWFLLLCCNRIWRHRDTGNERIQETEVMWFEGDPIWIRTLSSHWSGPSWNIEKLWWAMIKHDTSSIGGCLQLQRDGFQTLWVTGRFTSFALSFTSIQVQFNSKKALSRTIYICYSSMTYNL